MSARFVACRAVPTALDHFKARARKLTIEWYSVRYHSPADDLKQPWDPEAAAKFNEFFARLVEAIANASERPQWKSTSKMAPGK